MKRLREKGGFTLIELVVVMAIIAVLAMLIIGAIIVARRTATETTNRSNAKTMQTAIETYYSKNRSYPVISNVSLKALGTEGTTVGSNTILGNPKVTASCSGSIGAIVADDGGYVSSTSSGYTVYVADYSCTAETSTSDRLTGP